MRVDVSAECALRERVGDIRPVPVAHGRRSVFRLGVDVPVERSHCLRRIDDDAVALHPFAAELLEDRRIDVHVLPRAGEAAQRHAIDAIRRVMNCSGVLDELVESLGCFQSFRVVQVFAIDLHRDFAVVRNAIRLVVERSGIAPGLEDVVVAKPCVVGELRIGEIAIERIDPLVGDIQWVVHGIGRRRRIRRGLRRQIEHRFLPDLPGWRLLEAHPHAAQRFELRRDRDQVVEIAGGDHHHRDLRAFGLTPVDLRLLVRTRVSGLRVREARDPRRADRSSSQCSTGGDDTSPYRLHCIRRLFFHHVSLGAPTCSMLRDRPDHAALHWRRARESQRMGCIPARRPRPPPASINIRGRIHRHRHVRYRTSA